MLDGIGVADGPPTPEPSLGNVSRCGLAFDIRHTNVKSVRCNSRSDVARGISTYHVIPMSRKGTHGVPLGGVQDVSAALQPPHVRRRFWNEGARHRSRELCLSGVCRLGDNSRDSQLSCPGLVKEAENPPSTW